MRRSQIVQALILVAVIAGLAYVVIYVAEGWADWVVFGGILLATLGVIIAYHKRQYPPPTRKRAYTRGPDSEW